MIHVTDYEDSMVILTVDTTIITTISHLDSALTDGLVEIVRVLTDSTQNRKRAVGIDLRATGSDPLGAQETMIEALRGLVQSYTLETGHPVPPVNMVVSQPDQAHDRAATWRYLADPDAKMAWGATFDLRAVRV
jgi:hypothetical protein